MHEVVTLEGWSSPFVEAVTRTRFGTCGSMKMQPDGCWDVVIFRNGDTTTVLRTGLTTSTVTHDYAAGDEILAIAFKASSFMPLMPGEMMRDRGVVLDTIGKDRFRLGSDVLEIPTLKTVDGFVRKLVRNGNVEDNRVVASIVSGHPMAMSERTLQRHFLKTTGITYKTFTQIERAQKALGLLEQGRPAADVAFSLGYADQPHMIRSVKAIMGVTPGQIAHS
ncbi:helix-turn-helix transcriptional regulator [Aminobacter sp. AP02]|uniref:helix-turn-helix domain-containing protein n=1 Tax=Aminobacter sp. AP02 TaxID=2135737 RepID=UPI000D6B62FC|nr:helix-turn-helix transcriptional regulator [Aminobacter sp. AP02]PWK63684.1 helix-turn-helix protein [Aminobacter sp. AP02]